MKAKIGRRWLMAKLLFPCRSVLPPQEHTDGSKFPKVAQILRSELFSLVSLELCGAGRVCLSSRAALVVSGAMLPLQCASTGSTGKPWNTSFPWFVSGLLNSCT